MSSLINEKPTKTVNYLKNVLSYKILKVNKDLKDNDLINCNVKNCKTLDGFMSDVFQMQIKIRDKNNQKEKEVNLMIKMMKDMKELREVVKMDQMTNNELMVYELIIPYYKDILKDSKGEFNGDWAPRLFYGFYGKIPELENEDALDGVFAMENLSNQGYRMGPRAQLDESHLKLMIKSIANFHAMSYALKIQNKEKLEELTNSFQSFPFYEEHRNMHDVFYDIALERLFNHVTTTSQDKDFLAAVTSLTRKYIKKPSKLMEEFLEPNEPFDVIIHGDYNRNNVMFQYASSDGFDNPLDVKAFDYQLAKYASPVLDLSFFMFMNIGADQIDLMWDDLLQLYHETLMELLTSVLKCDKFDERLLPYSYEKFLDHFANYALYGCMVAAWFLPIMLCDLERCRAIEAAFEMDSFSQELKDVTLPAGGIEAIERVTAVTKHAFNRGYFKRIVEM